MEPRKHTFESGEPRLDKDGVAWWACDPYPTWYRRENGELITPGRAFPGWAD